jgi:hypothetical protein
VKRLVKKIVTLAKSTLMDTVKTGLGLGLVGLGGGVAGEIGSLVAGYVASNHLVKGDSFSSKFVWYISILNAMDILMERFTPRGVV